MDENGKARKKPSKTLHNGKLVYTFEEFFYCSFSKQQTIDKGTEKIDPNQRKGKSSKKKKKNNQNNNNNKSNSNDNGKDKESNKSNDSEKVCF